VASVPILSVMPLGLRLRSAVGYPRKTGQLEDSHRDLKCRKARPRWLRIQKPEALMLQSVPPYVDTPAVIRLSLACLGLQALSPVNLR